ncbi:MAG TPA: glycerophosphodiester phosphodiesterase family protein [Egibacteraceae bacterium]
MGRGRVGIYPETKHPSSFQSIGLPLEPRLVDVLHRSGYRSRSARVFIQSSEVANLKALDTMTDIPLVQLLDASGNPHDFVLSGDPRTYADLATPEGLAEIATYADGVGVNNNLVVPRDADGFLQTPTSLVGDAHDAGLLVHAWTFRNENSFLPADLRLASDPAAHGDAPAEYELFLSLGLDGVFSDHPDTAVAVRDARLGTPPWRPPLRAQPRP